MTGHNCRRPLLLPCLCVGLTTASLCIGASPAQERPATKAPRGEKVTLQYRVARDAYAPSRFVLVIGEGISAPLVLAWDALKQEKLKREFDDLIRKLEARTPA